MHQFCFSFLGNWSSGGVLHSHQSATMFSVPWPRGFHPIFFNNHPRGYKWSGAEALIFRWLKDDDFFVCFFFSYLLAIGMSSWEKFLSVTFVYLYFNAVILLLFLSCGKTTKNIKSNITQVLNALTTVSVTFSQVQWLLETSAPYPRGGKGFKRQIASWSYYEKVDFAVSLNGCWKTQGI